MPVEPCARNSALYGNDPRGNMLLEDFVSLGMIARYILRIDVDQQAFGQFRGDLPLQANRGILAP